jgi:hypothetical protein
VETVQLTWQRRRRDGVVHVCERVPQGAAVRQDAARDPGRAVLHERLSLGEAHPFDRHGHHDAREARLRLADHQCVHRAAGAGQFRRKLRQAGRHAGGGGVVAELGAEHRVDEEPLDQLVLAVTG